MIDLSSADHSQEFHNGKLYKIGANVVSGSDLWCGEVFQYNTSSTATLYLTASGALGTSANLGYNGTTDPW